MTQIAKAPVEAEDEFETIIPPTDLREKAVVRGGNAAANLASIRRAEKALEKLSENFEGWMKIETDRLLDAFEVLENQGVDEEKLDALFTAAHDIKGQAATLGYPLAGDICALLCDLIQMIPAPDLLPLVIVGKHVDTVSAILRQNIRSTDDETTLAVARELAAANKIVTNRDAQTQELNV